MATTPKAPKGRGGSRKSHGQKSTGLVGRNLRASLTREERMVTIASMIAKRITYREIAAELGINAATVCKDVKLIRERWRQNAAQSYDIIVSDELRELEEMETDVSRLWSDQLKRELSPEANGFRADLQLLKTRLDIKAAKAKLLGLNDTRAAREAAMAHAMVTETMRAQSKAIDSMTSAEAAEQYERLLHHIGLDGDGTAIDDPEIVSIIIDAEHE